jgi:mono/diheme cytochrome c family protein
MVRMKRAVLILTVFVAALALARHARLVAADSPTFTRDVAPILYARCVGCHRAGEVAPMSLLTYEDARPWARSIKARVVSRQMPPWQADPHVGAFANDPRLTDAQIATIAQWVDAGAPQGDPKDLPAPPAFTEGWQLGEPDQIIELPEVQIPATGADYFPTPALTPDIKEDRWLRAVEIRPSNRQVAHHVVIFSANPASFFAPTSSGLLDVLGVWAVGTPATVYPQGTGRWLRKGEMLRTNLHYHPNGTPQLDRTRIGLYFGKGELKKEVVSAVAGNVTFQIPAGNPNFELRSVYIVDQDVTVVSLFPHMHLRGKDMTMTATYPGGRQETLLSVPAYDFSWQMFYYPKTRVRLPKGTRIDLLAHYDNSAANKNNPDPTKPITFGEASATSEMMFGVVEFTADAGVSPMPSTPRSRMELLAKSFPADASFLIDLPFTTPPQPAVLHVPRNGAGGFYTIAGGVILPAPVANLVWVENTFVFNTLLRILGPGGGFFSVTGTIEKGIVRGKLQHLGRGTQPSYDFVGRRP